MIAKVFAAAKVPAYLDQYGLICTNGAA